MKILRYLSFVLISVVIVTGCFAAERTVQIVSLNGTVEIKRAGLTSWIPARPGVQMSEGDSIKTAPASRALLSIDDGKIGSVEVKEGSQMLISELKQDPETDKRNTLLDLAFGEVLIKAQKVSGEGSKFEVKTPTSLVGVRGTVFSVRVDTA